MLFVSSDGLHRRCAPLFLRQDQDFVWGEDLKADLKRLNDHFSQLPDAEKEKGIMRFARNPPLDGDFLVTKLWDKHLRRWRDSEPVEVPEDPEKNKKLVEHLTKFSEAPPLQPSEIDFDPRDPETLSIQRFVRKKKGSWWQLPKDLEIKNERS